jgi:hypothetical protein
MEMGLWTVCSCKLVHEIMEMGLWGYGDGLVDSVQLHVHSATNTCLMCLRAYGI